jgi:hypothetical protein
MSSASSQHTAITTADASSSSSAPPRNDTAIEIRGGLPRSTLEMRIGTDSQELLNKLQVAQGFVFPGINYHIALYDDLNSADVDVAIANSSKRHNTSRQRIALWIIVADRVQIAATGRVRYISDTEPLDTELALVLRLDVQRMILAQSFNERVMCMEKPRSRTDAEEIFPAFTANILTLAKLEIIDGVYDVDFELVNSVLDDLREWVTESKLADSDPLLQMSRDWATILATFPYYTPGVTARNSTIAQSSVSSTTALSSSSSDSDSWMEMFSELSRRRWAGDEITSDECKRLELCIVRCNPDPRHMLIILESLQASINDSIVPVQRYWYYSALYELIHISMISATIDENYSPRIGSILMKQAIEYAAERDRQLLTMTSIGRSPTDRVSVEIEDVLLRSVIWGLLNSKK